MIMPRKVKSAKKPELDRWRGRAASEHGKLDFSADRPELRKRFINLIKTHAKQRGTEITGDMKSIPTEFLAFEALTVRHPTEIEHLYATSTFIAPLDREYRRILKKKGKAAGYRKEDIRNAARLHDLGKMNVSPEKLRKPSRLTEEEFEEIKRHAQDSAKIAEELGLPGDVVTAIRQHHMYVNGGYPEKKSGEEVSRMARLLQVADSLEAATSARAHKSGKRIKNTGEIIEEFQNLAGKKYDKDAVDALVRVLSYKGGKFRTWWDKRIKTNKRIRGELKNA